MAEALIYKSLGPIRNQIKKIWLLNKSIDIIYGISKSLLFALPLLAIACLADWVWDIEEETPLPFRLLMTASWLSLLMVSLASYVVLPTIKRFKEDETALKIEQTFPEFDHRLITVLQLSRPEARFDKKSEKLLAELTGEVVACYPNFNFNNALELKKNYVRFLRLSLSDGEKNDCRKGAALVCFLKPTPDQKCMCMNWQGDLKI